MSDIAAMRTHFVGYVVAVFGSGYAKQAVNVAHVIDQDERPTYTEKKMAKSEWYPWRYWRCWEKANSPLA